MSRTEQRRRSVPVMKTIPEMRHHSKGQAGKRADGRVVMVGGAVPTCAEIGFSGKERVPPRSGTKRNSLLVVLAERAKNTRECCMKGKSWQL